MPDNRQIEILNDLLKTAERDFDATVKHAAAIEDKAQKTSGLAGLFLAAAFGFIKPDSLIALQRQYGNISVSLLYLALACFVISIGLCVRAMWLRKVPASGVSLASQEMPAQLLLQLPAHDLDDEVILAYKTNQVRIWSSAIDERFATNTDKTKLVHYAQRALSAGILVVTVSLVLLGYAVSLKQDKAMPENTSTPENSAQPGSESPSKLLKFRPGKTRQEVLDELKNKDFIALQIRRLSRAK